jgi:hypothetical protein
MTSPTRHTHRGLLAVLVASLFVLGSSVAASATGGHGAVDTSTTNTADTGVGATGDSDNTAVGTRGTCSVVSTSSYLGVSCAGGDLGNPKSIKQILGGQDLPTCWNEPMSDTEKAALNLQDVSPKTWYWVRCLSGIDPKTLKKTGEVKISVSWAAYGPGDKLTFLKGGQKALVSFFSKDKQIPYPIAGVSPLAHPRVGGWLSIFDGSPIHEVSVPEGAVTLTATEVGIDVEPLGVGVTPLISCHGTGYVAKPGETPVDKPAPDACWYQYKQSSADQPGNAYPVNVTSHWEVYVSVNGVRETTPFNAFSKSQVTKLPVTEIQAIVVQ